MPGLQQISHLSPRHIQQQSHVCVSEIQCQYLQSKMEDKPVFSLNYSQTHTELKCIRLTGMLIVDPHTDALNTAFVKKQLLRAVGILQHPKSFALSTCHLSPAKLKQMNKAQRKLGASTVCQRLTRTSQLSLNL